MRCVGDLLAMTGIDARQPDTREIRTGSCLCGLVQIEAIGAPEGVAVCHCDSCRKHTGAAFAVYADYRADHVAFPRMQPEVYVSSPGVQRGFCGKCGSTIFYKGANLPGMIHLHIGIFDDAAAFQPDTEEATGQRLPWVQIALKAPSPT